MEDPFKSQIGGEHYKNMAIQPFEYAMANQMNAGQFAVVKYVSRYLRKGGIEDLKKAKHFLDLMIALEERKGTQSNLSPASEDWKRTDDGVWFYKPHGKWLGTYDATVTSPYASAWSAEREVWVDVPTNLSDADASKKAIEEWHRNNS